MPKRIQYDPSSHHQTISDCRARKTTIKNEQSHSVSGIYGNNYLTKVYQAMIVLIFLLALMLHIQ